MSLQVRAPEESVDAPLTEKLDVYSLGNVLFSVMTGRLTIAEYDQWYEDENRQIVRDRSGEIPAFCWDTPGLDHLASVVVACWTYNVEARPSIFEIVSFLEAAVTAHPVR